MWLVLKFHGGGPTFKERSNREPISMIDSIRDFGSRNARLDFRRQGHRFACSLGTAKTP
jgi:hypothetical protein